MKKISRRAFLQASGLLAAAAMGSGLTGCSSNTASSSAGSTVSAKEHQPITIMDGLRDYTKLMELVHAQYPEIQLDIEAYCGSNTTGYMSKQLRTGYTPDIYVSTQLWDPEWQKKYLIDLSQYEISDHYNEVRMDDTDVDGANYLLPYDYSVLAFGYNKSLFERQGWEVPTSFAELSSLMENVQAAGVEPCACQLNLPGLGFQFFCNVSDTVFLNSMEGRQWQSDFLAGTANATDHLQECKDYFQQWIDIGFFNHNIDGKTKGDYFNSFREGNTAFFGGWLGRYTQEEDGTGDQYDCFPFLSPDGSNNFYVIQIARYYGLSNRLLEKGNEQKLEDALHFLEILSSLDGYDSVIGKNPSSLCSLKDFTLEEDSIFNAVLDSINQGHAANLIYSGWDSYIVPMGNAVISWIKGEITGDEALAVLDSTQREVLISGSAPVFAEVPERLDNEQTTKLFGLLYLDATGADAALMSRNIWIEGVDASQENGSGINGTMLPGDLTEEDIVVNLPTGWHGTLHTLTLTGARIKEVAAAGYDHHNNGIVYPYLLVTRDGMELEDNTTYTVAYAGASDALLEEGHDTDTGIVGLDAAEAYFKKLGTITPELLK